LRRRDPRLQPARPAAARAAAAGLQGAGRRAVPRALRRGLHRLRRPAARRPRPDHGGAPGRELRARRTSDAAAHLRRRRPLDAAPATIVTANYLARAVIAPPGDHVIEYRFALRGFWAGAWLSGLGLLCCAALVAYGYLRSRRLKIATASAKNAST